MNHNSMDFEVIVRRAMGTVRRHLSDVREDHGLDPHDPHYFNAETGRGASDDDILDNVRDLVTGDLLNDERHEHIDAADLSDAASEAVSEYVKAERRDTPMSEDVTVCKVCGQPDNCGDCDHGTETGEWTDPLGGGA